MYIYILDCVENAKKSWTYYIVPFSTKKYPISKLLETLEKTQKRRGGLFPAILRCLLAPALKNVDVSLI